MMRSKRLGAVVVVGIIITALLGFAAIAQAEPNAQKPTPHTFEGRDNCLACHAAGGLKPIPASHAGRTNETCRACHPAAPAPAAVTPAPGATPQPAVPANPNDACLSCHSNPNVTTLLADGKPISLFVDNKVYSNSVHGKKKLNCVDCHTDISGYPHPPLKAKDARDYSLTAYELCRRCHPANYTKTQDSMHAQILKTANRFAPVCTDCHGDHDVVPPDQPRTRITSTCAGCHQPIYDTYKQSVHGRALTDELNQDVPTCVDCHGVHQIVDPRTAAFRAESPEMCARCHTDEKLMGKYQISTKVYATYEEDFHGTTVQFYKTKWPTIWCYKAVCTDCHGIHEIRKTFDPTSSVYPSNLLKTCQKCHPDAPPNFTSAWTGHYQPSLDSVPLVYYVQLFYQSFFIPVVIGGMVVYVLLDFIRTMIDRRRAAAATPAKEGKEAKTTGGRHE